MQKIWNPLFISAVKFGLQFGFVVKLSKKELLGPKLVSVG